MSKSDKKLQSLCKGYANELKENGANASVILVETGEDDRGCIAELRGSIMSFLPLLSMGLAAALEPVPMKALREELLDTFISGVHKALNERPLGDELDIEDEGEEDEGENDGRTYAIKIPCNSKQSRALAEFLKEVLEELEETQDEG